MPLNIDWQQILLHVFNFLLLTLALYVLVYKPVAKFLAEREEKFKVNAEQAKALEAKERKLVREEAMHRSEMASQKEVEKRKALAEAEAEANKILQSAQKEADSIVEAAHTAAEKEKAKVMAEAKLDLRELVVNSRKAMLNPQLNDYEEFLEAAQISPSEVLHD